MPGSLTRGRFTYFPVVPGRAGVRHRSARRPSCATGRRWSRVELPATLQPAWMRAVARLPEMSVIFYPDESAGDDQAVYVPVEPADPFTEAIRTGLEIGAEIVFADPDAGQRPHLQGRLSRHVRDPPHRPRALRRGLPRLSRSRAPTRSGAPRRRHRLETAGRRSAGATCWWWSRSTCSTRCSTPWRSRRRSPWRARRREGIELLNPHPESLGRDSARISGPAVALRAFSRR